jgi:PhnB protein
MKGFNPYLTFSGDCRDALNYYKQCFNGEIVSMQTFGEAPGTSEGPQGKMIMHAVFRAGSIFFMASDAAPGQPLHGGNNITLNVDFENADLQEKVFKKLADGGVVNMPLQDTFWGARFGMVTDKFGINWMTNCELKKK